MSTYAYAAFCGFGAAGPAAPGHSSACARRHRTGGAALTPAARARAGGGHVPRPCELSRRAARHGGRWEHSEHSVDNAGQQMCKTREHAKRAPCLHCIDVDGARQPPPVGDLSLESKLRRRDRCRREQLLNEEQQHFHTFRSNEVTHNTMQNIRVTRGKPPTSWVNITQIAQQGTRGPSLRIYFQSTGR